MHNEKVKHILGSLLNCVLKIVILPVTKKTGLFRIIQII